MSERTDRKATGGAHVSNPTGNSLTSGPAATGVRLAWADLPASVRSAAEIWLGSAVVTVASQPGGFSPGVAARVRTADGSRVFVKAIGAEPNPLAPTYHRREAEIVAALPRDAPIPRLLWSYDDGSWVVLVFEDADGRHPVMPWRAEELARVLNDLVALSAALTPSPLPATKLDSVANWGVVSGGWWARLRDEWPARLDQWSRRHLDALVGLERFAPMAATGRTLLHLDLRADNLLLTPERVLVVDWPHARVGAAWVDLAFFAPSVAMQGGPLPDELLAHHPDARAADAEAVTAVVAAIAGFFTQQALQPAPPGLPTLRAFQAAQGVAARRWLADRTGRA